MLLGLPVILAFQQIILIYQVFNILLKTLRFDPLRLRRQHGRILPPLEIVVPSYPLLFIETFIPAFLQIVFAFLILSFSLD
jgi:hypothetical protein